MKPSGINDNYDDTAAGRGRPAAAYARGGGPAAHSDRAVHCDHPHHPALSQPNESRRPGETERDPADICPGHFPGDHDVAMFVVGFFVFSYGFFFNVISIN